MAAVSKVAGGGVSSGAADVFPGEDGVRGDIGGVPCPPGEPEEREE